MRYRVLGPLRVLAADGCWVGCAPKAAAVLACLLLKANEVVPVERLALEVWGADQPQRASASIHVYVSQLRKLCVEPGRPSPLITTSSGYLLQVEPGELDSTIFTELVAEARAAADAGNDLAAERLLVQAMDMCTGSALAELRNGPLINSLAGCLDDALLDCTELRMEIGLRLGRTRQLVPTLRRLTIEHPLHEGFYACLMRALWGCGRRADALEVFHQAWELLARELGLEPGLELQRLHAELLDEGMRSFAKSQSA
jgi:DNA-binding SARP family transcriptional activator